MAFRRAKPPHVPFVKAWSYDPSYIRYDRVLRHACAMIGEPTHCTRGALSEAAGQSCGHNEKACRWCALAAIIRVAYNLVGG